MKLTHGASDNCSSTVLLKTTTPARQEKEENVESPIYIVSSASITGAGLDVSSQWNALTNGGPKFVTLNEACKNWLPWSLDGLHESLQDLQVCPVQRTNAELAEVLDVKTMGYDRHQLFGMIAAQAAMSGVDGYDPEYFACESSTGGAGLIDLYQTMGKLRDGKKLGPRDNLKYLPNMYAGYLTQRHNIQGSSTVQGSACAASMHAINSLIRMIRCGEVEGGLVVGAEAAISQFGIGSFAAQRALGNGLPFHVDRSGFVMGEGAAALVLANQDLVDKLGIVPIGKITGYAATSDASQDGAVTAPNPAGAARSMEGALNMAGWEICDVDIVKSHGTATPAGDISEITAVQRVADQQAVGMPEVMSVKSYFGHLLGAAGIAEIAMVLEMIKHQTLLPTRGLSPDTVDPDCHMADHVTVMQQRDIETVLCNGFGFGGTNASMVIEAA